MRLLVTRPAPDGDRTTAELRARGHDVLWTPMLRVETVADPELGVGPLAGVLLTSANGARAVATHRRHSELAGLPTLAVGVGTAKAAREAGFVDVTSADGDGGDLARLASARFAGASAPLLYAAGEKRARELGGMLAAEGIVVRTVVVYRTVKSDAFAAPVVSALRRGAIDGVLHFSRRSAEAYLACAEALSGAALAPVHYCLSDRTAEPLRRAGAVRILTAERPDEAALLALVTPAP